MKPEPNQALSTTTTAVTSRACARPAPAGVVADLGRWAKTMKPSLIFLAVFAMSLAGCASNRFGSAQITEIRLRDGIPGQMVRKITEPSGLALFSAMLGRSEMRKNTDEDVQNALWHGRCFDIYSTSSCSGRWLYDEKTDRIARLDIWGCRYVYTVGAIDRQKLHNLLKIGPNKTPVPATSVTPAADAPVAPAAAAAQL